MLQYETIFVSDPNLTDEEVDAIVGLVDQITVAAGGKVLKTEKWGKRRLAYPIGHREEGIYVLMTLECPTTLVKEIDRRYRVNDRILRHLTVRVEDASQLGPSPMMKPRPAEARDEAPSDPAVTA
jgi:small subunit ribosomal protein S6